MKTLQPLNKALTAALAASMLFASCQKEPVNEPETFSSESKTAIAIAANITADGSVRTSDSIYAVNACQKDDEKRVIEESSLRAEISNYIKANYPGSTFLKAFKIARTKSENVVNYVVAVRFNNKPVALQFDAEGNFIKVLELREKRNLRGIGWHRGGWFENRDWKHRDTIALTSLSSAVKLYFSTTYPQDTLLHAIVNKHGNVIVLSRNDEFYATIFTAGSILIKRIKLPAVGGNAQVIAVTELPANTQTYLGATYPGYVLHKAFSVTLNGTLTGYIALIDANLTKYALRFDANGQFISAMTVR